MSVGVQTGLQLEELLVRHLSDYSYGPSTHYCPLRWQCRFRTRGRGIAERTLPALHAKTLALLGLRPPLSSSLYNREIMTPISGVRPSVRRSVTFNTVIIHRKLQSHCAPCATTESQTATPRMMFM